MTPLTAIVGAGPAGCAAARLLSAWGHRVLVIERPGGERRALAESIPPSADKVLAAIGMLPAVQDAGFQPWRGNTVWWGTDAPRVETFPVGVAGYQVERGGFDRLLRGLVQQSGAEVRTGLVRRVLVPALDTPAGNGEDVVVVVEAEGRLQDVRAAVVLDCSGRAGIVARSGLRRAESSHRTVALAGVWTADEWPDADATHTLVASYHGGWAWSVPIASRVRYFTVMVDPARSDLARADRATTGRQSQGAGSHSPPKAEVYLAELGKVDAFRRVLQYAQMTGEPWGADASVYDAHRYGGPGFLLVGDAGSFIDPLSSFGVKKALASGWLAAVVTHTMLRQPGMRDEALAFFDRREREVYAAARRQAAEFAASATAGTPAPFWQARAALPDVAQSWSDIDAAALARDPAVLATFADLKRRVTITLRENPAVGVALRPLVRQHEIVLDEHLLLPDAPDGVRYLRDIDLVALRRLAPSYRDVGDLCDAVARSQAGAALPDILGALSFLIARGALLHATP